MSQNDNPLSAAEPWNLVADGYAETTTLVFEQFADEAIAASKLKPNSTVLDVACGPGQARATREASKRHRLLRIHACQEMQDAGFRNVEIHRVTKAFPVGTVPEFWDSMVKGSAPIQMMKKNMGEELWRVKEKVALAWLEETLPTLKMPLTSDAWLGVGVKS